VIVAADLLTWLHQELLRDDIAALLESLLADSSLDDDLRLLHLCHAIWPRMPTLWRGRELTEDHIDAAARAAMAGDGSSLEWLQSLHDGHCFDFYAAHGHPEVGLLAQRWRDAWTGYQATWDTLLSVGAPVNARLADSATLPHVVRLVCSEEIRTALRHEAQHLLDPATLLLREPWFLHFGTDLMALSDPQLLVLRDLDKVSLLSEYQVIAIDQMETIDPQQLRVRPILFETQERLLRHLAVPPGARIVMLRPGDSHRARPPGSLRDWFIIWVDRLTHALARWHTRAVDDSLSVEVRLIRITTAVREYAFPFKDEIYLALIVWRAAEGLRVKLHVRHPGLLLALPRLITPSMPPNGQILLVLSGDTQIRLVGQRGWFRRSLRTRPILVRFQRVPEPVEVLSDPIPPHVVMIDPVSKIMSYIPRLKTVYNAMVVSRNNLIPVPASSIIAVSSHLTTPYRLPTASERCLAAKVEEKLEQLRRNDVHES